ncbi:MAG: patatin-like phospholipase family protein [Prevotella sp.]|nr:patatin-like phospholipase family protein [Prevotella sp.]
MVVASPIVANVPHSRGSNPESRPRVGIVFGGGGAKGAAEVGVMKVIEKAGIPIDYIAGSSIGAIVGGLYSVGYRSETLDSLFKSQEWLSLLADRKREVQDEPIIRRDGVTYVFGFPIFRDRSASQRPNPDGRFRFGAIRGDNIVALLDSMVTNSIQCSTLTTFDSLPIPFRCVAVDASTFSEVELGSGNLPLAMRASMAIPGLFKPVEMGDSTLLDGGMLNNLPVDIVRNMGADIVIAIDLTVNHHDDDDDNLIGSVPWGSLFGKNGLWGIIDWVFSRPDLEKYAQNSKSADLYINPDLDGYAVTEFSRQSIIEMIDIGEQAALRQWKELKQLRKRIYGK